MNILFVMYDQLRFDYLSCAGHPHLHTPNFDRVAARGVRFTNAYVQSPICGASRMSTYTGRYPSSHGAGGNNFPLRIGEMTLGDHLRDAGMDCILLGKTHNTPDWSGMARLGIDPKSKVGQRIVECGFDAQVRDDGLWAQGPDGYYDPGHSHYNDYLKSKGYLGENPWANHANAGVHDDGSIASGWIMDNADKAANIREEDSETAWLTSQTLAFLDQPHDRPWCAHVSYIKPHWPYIAPAPYHAMFGSNDVLPPVRDAAERGDPHPVFGAYMDNKIAAAFQNDPIRDKVVRAYMGLVKQCDDHLGRILDHLDKTGQADDTVIVLTSDHGDYLGDHWMGEKDLFHDPSVKVPLIIADPRPAANATRGTTCDALVAAIDLAPTFVEMAGGTPADHILEGQSLVPWLHGQTPEYWRDFVVSEFDYTITAQSGVLGVGPKDARLFMVFDGRYKLMHAEGGLGAQLFDLHADPNEFIDQARNPAHAEILQKLYGDLATWGRRCAQRVTISDADLNAKRGKAVRKGILPFLADGSEVEEDLLSKYTGQATAIYTTES